MEATEVLALIVDCEFPAAVTSDASKSSELVEYAQIVSLYRACVPRTWRTRVARQCSNYIFSFLCKFMQQWKRWANIENETCAPQPSTNKAACAEIDSMHCSNYGACNLNPSTQHIK